MKFLCLSLMVLFVSCSSQKTVVVPQKPAPVVVPTPVVLPVIVPPIVKPVLVETVTVDKNCAPKTWSSSWDKIIVDSLVGKESLLKFNKEPKYWVAVIKALAKAESCLNLSSRYVERGLGKDAVTGQQNTSEGLLQLSYQDTKFHGCKFDWAKDKLLPVASLQKTIFDPKLNIECGMVILNKQLALKGNLITPVNAYYWAVLNRPNNRYAEFKKYLASEGF